MNCESVRERLTPLLEDSLSAHEALEARAHVAECASCRAAYTDASALVTELRAMPPPPTPAGLRGRIDAALNGAEGTQSRGAWRTRSIWESATPYLAAAAVIVIAFAAAMFVSHPRSSGLVAKAPTDMLPAQPARSGASDPVPGDDASTADEASDDLAAESRAQEATQRAIEELKKARDEEVLQDINDWLLRSPLDEDAQDEPAGPAEGAPSTSPELGGPAVPNRGGPSDKPPGAFAVSPNDERNGTATETPTGPVSLQWGFDPPESATVGKAANGVVEITSQESIPRVTVRATGDSGLTIDKPGGVLWEGTLRAGEKVRIPLPMTASTVGAHQVDVYADSAASTGGAPFTITVPFKAASEPPPAPETSPADKPVSLVFQNAPVRQALMDIARQADLRMEMAEGLGTERITRDLRGIPARAALRSVAEAAGYTLTERDGVFHVTRD